MNVTLFLLTLMEETFMFWCRTENDCTPFIIIYRISNLSKARTHCVILG